MTLRPSLTLFTAINGQRIDHAAPTALRWSHGVHGCEAMIATIPMEASDALRLTTKSGVPHAVASAAGGVIWSGRVEEIVVVEQGVEVRAYGYWTALSDTPYTAVWSDTRTSQWIPTDNAANFYTPGYYSFNTISNQLRIDLVKNTVYAATAATRAGLAYTIPNASSRNITRVEFTYAVTLPIGFTFALHSYDAAYGTATTEYSAAATGALQTGSVAQTLANGRPIVVLAAYNSSGAAITNLAETSGYFAVFSAVRVKTFDVSLINPNYIITDLLTTVPNLGATAITANTIDLSQEVYEDASRADIINRLCAMGDASSNRWEFGVDANRVPYYRQVGTNAKEIYADIDEPDFSRSIRDMYNAIYVIYQNANGRQLRSPQTSGALTPNTNAQSVAAFGLTRTLGVKVGATVSPTLVMAVESLARAYPVPKIGVRIRRIEGVPPWLIKAGDWLNIRNLPPFFPDVGGLRRFRIARVEYDALTDTVQIESENPAKAIDVIMAQNAVGIGIYTDLSGFPSGHAPTPIYPGGLYPAP